MKPIIEHLWQPLVSRSDQQRLILVQPGAVKPTIEIHDRRFWHWPFLTSARLINSDPFDYRINQNIKVSAHVPGDESIVAATKDLHLVKITAQLQLQLDPQAKLDTLSNINRHFINRILRPTIRQYIRLEIANYQHDQLADIKSITDRIIKQLKPALHTHGYLLLQCHIATIAPFDPFKSSK